MLQFLITRAGEDTAVTVILNNKPVTVTASDDNYDKLVNLVKNPAATEVEVEELIFSKAKAIEAALTKDGDVTMEGGLVVVGGVALPDSLSQRLIQMAEEGFDVTPLKMFAANLAQNPSNSVFRRLYDFLEIGKMALTQDGCFLAYKKIRVDGTDIYTGKFNNSVGQVVKVNRRTVDDDSRVTCSTGLHVCSYDYLPHFGSSDYGTSSRVVVCKVNPRDVVAIPDDYNNTKMRVCEYEVTAEVTDYLAKDDNVLSSSSVNNGSDMLPFAVRIQTAGDDHYRDSDDTEWKTIGNFAKLSQAAAFYEEQLDGARDFIEIELFNASTDEVLETATGNE